MGLSSRAPRRGGDPGGGCASQGTYRPARRAPAFGELGFRASIKVSGSSARAHGRPDESGSGGQSKSSSFFDKAASRGNLRGWRPPLVQRTREKARKPKMGKSNPYTWHPADSRTGKVVPQGYSSFGVAAENAAELGLDAVAETEEGVLTGQGARLEHQPRRRVMEKSFGMFPKGQRIE